MAFGGEIRRKPGEEEHQRRVAGELAEANARQLTMLEQASDGAPFEAALRRYELAGCRLSVILPMRETAARFDIVELRLIRRRMIARLTIEHPPDHAEHEAHAAHHVEQRTPAERAHQHEQERAEKSEADIFADRVRAGRHRAFTLREPRGHHPADSRKARRSIDAEAESQREQRADAM